MRSPAVVALVASLFVTWADPAAAGNAVLGPGTTLYVNPASSTQQAAAKLEGQARADALLLAGLT
jgi:endoglucanase